MSKALCGVPEEEGVPVKTHPFLCGKDGVDLLKKDVAGGTNTLVIAACSRRVNFDIFRFDGCIVDRVNLREGVVWSHPRSEFPALTEEEKEDEDNFDRVQMMAEDYIKMGMIRVEKIDAARALLLENLSKKILVIGGGITGMSAAIDAAKAGYVTIVEKTSAGRLCGQELAKADPGCGTLRYADPSGGRGQDQAEVEAMPNITVRTETEVARIAGQPGEFTVTLKSPVRRFPSTCPFHCRTR
jgi:quinone-modifying oxidoreductase subunit QmoB